MAKDKRTEINHRAGKRALATARVAGSAVRLAGRRLFRRREGERDQVLGERLASELDQMKGLAMKVGQILSYFDGVLPEGTHQALRVLQRGASPVAFSAVAAVIEGAFGEPVAALFDSIDEEPVAAASIGQVHRARLGGREVAVKVQYPNVRKTFEADTSRIRTLSKLASLASSVDGPAIADELRERVLEECDYVREAQNQEAFARAFAGDPDVVIPEVVWERTRNQVLTTRWCDGLDFYGFAERTPAARRTEVARVLMRFAYESLYGLAAINADPHPGNYVFGESSVAFLDFGCVRYFEADFLERERALTRVVLDDRRDAFDEALIATGMVAKPKRFDFDAHWAMLCQHYAPYRQPRFRFTRDYLRAVMRMNGPSNPNLRRLAIPPAWIWLQRLQFGLHAVLVRLEAEGEFGDILRAALAR